LKATKKIKNRKKKKKDGFCLFSRRAERRGGHQLVPGDVHGIGNIRRVPEAANERVDIEGKGGGNSLSNSRK